MQSRRCVTLALAASAPLFAAPSLAGLGPALIYLAAATVAAPIAVVALWAWLGGRLQALCQALLLALLAVASTAFAVVVATATDQQSFSEGTSITAEVAFILGAVPALFALGTALVLLPFAWRRSRIHRRASKPTLE